MNEKVITVREGQKLLYEIIKEIVDAHKMFVMINIDKEFIESDKLIKQSDDVEYKFEKDGYEFLVDAGVNANNKWYFLLEITAPEGGIFYSLRNPYFMDVLDKKCEHKEIYLRRWGSKQK